MKNTQTINELTHEQLQAANRNIGYATEEDRSAATDDEIKEALREAVDDGHSIEDFVR